jgi:hypothetical protein
MKPEDSAALRMFLRREQERLSALLEKAWQAPGLSGPARDAVIGVIAAQSSALFGVEVELDRLELTRG